VQNQIESYFVHLLEDGNLFLEFSGILVSILLLIATGLGSFAAVASFLAAKKNNQTAKLAILNELAVEWSRVQNSWSLAQAVVRGTDDYYSPLLSHQEKLITRAHKRYQKSPFKKNVALNEIRTEVEVLVQFFDRLSIKILEGALSPADAYSILGPSVARHSRVVRWSVGAATATPDLDGRFRRAPDLDWVRYPVSEELRGRRSRVIYLSDALWSELAQMRDLEAHNISAAAIHKNSSGSGRQAQKRAFELAKSFGKRTHALKLSHHLTYSEYIPKCTFTDFGVSGFSEVDELAAESHEEISDARLTRTLIKRIILLRFRILAP